MKKAPTSKADRKATLDAASWMFNIVSSVGIIIVNKALMATYGFSFATTLTGLHFATTTLMTLVLRWLGYIQTSHLPLSELLKFALFAKFSIVGMNVSLMWNSAGFYQVYSSFQRKKRKGKRWKKSEEEGKEEDLRGCNCESVTVDRSLFQRRRRGRRRRMKKNKKKNEEIT